MVHTKEVPACSERTSRAISRVGQSVNVAVDRFVTVGEAIADSSDEIRPQMYAACQEARLAGATIEKLCDYAHCESMETGNMSRTVSNKADMVRASRCLLAAVTRVLLLVDTVVVKQLLLDKDKIVNTLMRLEAVTNFTEFVKAFSQFGIEMVELAQLTGDRLTEVKDERRRAQIEAARHVLERSTMMLLTSAKTCLRHPECSSARENRDTVFCQMRRAMDLIHYVVKDGVLDTAASLVTCPSSTQPNRLSKKDDWEGNQSLNALLNRFIGQVEIAKMTLVGPQARQQLPEALDFILERIQDFTDSAYTSHEHRENILLLCDGVGLQVNQLLRVGLTSQGSGLTLNEQKEGSSIELEQAIDGTLKSVYELRNQLQETAFAQASDMMRSSKEVSEIVDVMRNAALTTDSERLEEVSQHFNEHLERTQEVCKSLRHISTTDTFHVQCKYAEINLKIYGPQLAVAARTLCSNPTSKAAKENLDVFVDMWQSLANDIEVLTHKIAEVLGTQSVDSKFYMSLPRPGKHGTTQKRVVKPAELNQKEEEESDEKVGKEMQPVIATEAEPEAEKWTEDTFQDENNDIVRRAKNMSNMAFNMYQFTHGDGPLKTTQDLFTQAEYFAEEANRLYKVVRQFSYMVPTSSEKKGLLEKVDEVPTRVQQLQFTVKNPTVGKAATFTKVDSVIESTKNLMNVISNVVTTCFECASKYKLDFRGLSPRGRNSPFGRSDSEEVGGGSGSGDSKGGGGTSSDGSM